MKKLFLPVIMLFVLCLCGCPMEDVSPPYLYIDDFKTEVKENEVIEIHATVISGCKDSTQTDSTWIIYLNNIPTDAKVIVGKKNEVASSADIFAIDGIRTGVDSESKICFSYKTPGIYEIKINACPSKTFEKLNQLSGCGNQEYYTYTITVTE